MKRSFHIALAGCAALLGSTAVSSAAPAVVPQGVVVSAIAQSDLNAILREIQKGTPVAQVLARYDLTAADLQRLEELAAQLGIDDVRDFRRELRSIVREIRSGVPIGTVLRNRGLTEEELQRAMELAQRLGIDVARVMDRLEKHAERTAKPRPGDDEDDTTRTRGASRFAPGQQKTSGESARERAPGQQTRTGTTLGASSFAPGQRMLDDIANGGGSSAPGGSGGRGGGSGGGGSGGGQGGGGGHGGGGDHGGNGNGGGAGNGNGGGNGGGKGH